MPRPCKRRRICQLPACRCFAPKNGSDTGNPPVTMTIDEYETIRLIDFAGMTQEQCAAQMDVARTTAQAIYNSARFKLAECLVNGKELHIQGGSYLLCEDDPQNQACSYKSSGHCRHNIKKKENGIMKIAVTYENGQIFQHFGHTEQFKIYEIEDGKITSSSVVDTNGSGHGALAGFLDALKVDTLICGGIGGGARQALDAAGIKLYGGASGDADEAVKALLSGSLSFDPDVQCSHHEGHHHEGNCGEHGCGEHHCGQ
jgi:predicted DNA-binding protein (UPF0251 family)/predicted Fe-Mo cluster-binding NifX family protein